MGLQMSWIYRQLKLSRFIEGIDVYFSVQQDSVEMAFTFHGNRKK